MKRYQLPLEPHSVDHPRKKKTRHCRGRGSKHNRAVGCLLFVVLAVWFGGETCLTCGVVGTIRQDTDQKQVILADGQAQLILRLNYDGRCILDQVMVRGREVAAQTGVKSGICIGGQWFTTGAGIATPAVLISNNTLTVSGIVFGKPGSEVHESWRFTVQQARILWRIQRKYSTGATLDDAAFPEWDFSSMSAWTGGMLDNGGVVWNKYLDGPNATYGAHAGTVTFWNREKNDALRIAPTLPKERYGSVRFSHQTNNTFSFNYVISDEEVNPKHDLCRFLSDGQDLWAPFRIGAGEVTVEFALEALDYGKVSNFGTFQGLNGGSIRELLNTVARYGVIDSGVVGANGWRSGYACLHEQWFAQIALASGDPAYIANLSHALDFERDHAIDINGRVKSRWSYNSGDSMPGTYDQAGFYEAQWGYLMDSQPTYVITVAELFDLTSDRAWLAGQKSACEKALDFLIRRQVEHSGLVAMMTDSCKQQRGSDWIDIIWASYENALVNAELYYALELWAKAEETLADPAKAATYGEFATRLKSTFNRPVSEGGFWDPANRWYVYWRDKDGSIHGNNLVTPVNFAAIAYGICDDAARQKAILDRIETEMQKENLFYWPLNFFPYQREEGSGGNFPFPSYENGDLFLSWGELAVRAYAAHDPSVALKYIKKILDRYDEDGLSFQRYLRRSQRGAGDDILAGNCMPIVGLYRDIYGVQPKPNRLYLEPHLADELNGTMLRYPLRGRLYQIKLSTVGYEIISGLTILRDARAFGINATDTGLEYFPGTNVNWAMSISRSAAQPLTVQIEQWPESSDEVRRWTESGSAMTSPTEHVVAQLRPDAVYELKANGRTFSKLQADQSGRLRFSYRGTALVPRRFELVLTTR